MNKKFLKISVITPSLNQGKFIEETIKSVLNQNYPNLEYIVMDGGSNDNTISILKKYSKQISWYSQRDRGQADAINKGMKLAKGDIIAYLNSDDLYFSNTLFTVNDYFNQHERMKWVTGKCRIIDSRGKEIRKWLTAWKNLWLKKVYLKIPTKWGLYTLNFLSQPSTFWRREVIDKVGYFDISLKYVMDYDYWLKTSKEFKLGFIDKYLSYFRVYASSKSGKGYYEQFSEGYRIVQKYTDIKISLLCHRLHDFLTVNIYDRLPY